MNYRYLVTKPELPPRATTPVMDSRDMEGWLNSMDDKGWELVTYGATHWNDMSTQDWWIFRRPRNDNS